ncbi:hypothetical protein LCGC14_1203260 [marine sediment metagenome]|uniref:Uncharacterized protein n=1 Tax=marine sediment metagenome TaxID=412755 RepID=A0A0F9M3L5_9ZZZZ
MNEEMKMLFEIDKNIKKLADMVNINCTMIKNLEKKIDKIKNLVIQLKI